MDQREAGAGPYTTSLGTEVAIDIVQQGGKDAEPLLEAAGLDPLGRYGPGVKVKAQAQALFFELAAEALDHEYLGIEVARRSKFIELGPLIYLAQSAPTLVEAIASLSKHLTLLSDSDVLNVEYQGDQVVVTAMPQHDVADHHRHIEDCGTFFFVSLCKHLAGDDLTPHEVRMRYPDPPEPSRHHVFFGCPVIFGHPHNQTVLRREDIEIKLRTSDAALHATLAGHCEKLAREKDTYEPEFVHRVKMVIEERLPNGSTSVADVATEIGISVRSLQRRLDQEGASFQALRDDVRSELANRYLSGQHMSISQIAHQLGYSGEAAFHAAFKRLTGQTPGEARTELRSPPRHQN